VLLRFEVAVVAGLKMFVSRLVTLEAIVNKEVDADGNEEYWVLFSTSPVADPVLGRRDYALRTTIEERHR
jgi:hypothetical protein